MDEIVALGMAKWPNVPAVYGWLQLDRRGNWRIKGERVGNPALREFICRNYQPDSRGCWFFQNGPQRVFVALAYTPLVVHYEGEGEALIDHCGRPFAPGSYLQDEEGSVLARASVASPSSTTVICSACPTPTRRPRSSCAPRSPGGSVSSSIRDRK
jgi:hypothetical protein